MNSYDLPDPDDMDKEQINEYYGSKYGGMDPEKGDKDWEVSDAELDNIEKFLRDFDNRHYPPNGPEDYIF